MSQKEIQTSKESQLLQLVALDHINFIKLLAHHGENMQVFDPLQQKLIMEGGRGTFL